MTRIEILPRGQTDRPCLARVRLIYDSHAQVVLAGQRIERVSAAEGALLGALGRAGNAPLSRRESGLSGPAFNQAVSGLRRLLPVLGLEIEACCGGYWIARPPSPKRKSYA